MISGSFSFKKRLLLLALAVFLYSCYEPKPFSASQSGGSSTPTSKGNLIAINSPDGKSRGQVCNVSASQDPVKYPAHLLCLNFSGPLNCNLDSSLVSELQSTIVDGFGMHKELFIIDTTNTLRWHFSAPAGWGKMQDPEWSNHPDFISFSGGMAINATTQEWYGYGLRISTKDTLCFMHLSTGFDDFSDIFLWVGDGGDTGLAPAVPSRKDESFVSRSKVVQFLGTSEAKLVYLVKYNGALNEIHVVDYRVSQDKPDTLHLPRPSDDPAYAEGRIEAPIVSPDGKWVTFHFVEPNQPVSKGSTRIYVQELRQGATPVFVAKGGEPHFWSDAGDLFLVYTDSPGNIPSTTDLLDTPPDSLGQTFIREIGLSTTRPLSIRVNTTALPQLLVPYPMKGGMSKSGLVVATGLELAYFWVNR